MAHLIDKDALVSEINRRIEEITLTISLGNKKIQKSGGNRRAELERFLSLLDTLEVKEVDLEKYYHDFLQKEWFDKNCNRTMSEMMAFTAKHFFELGMAVSNKAQKRE